ncbi:hypothetical protein HGA88_00945 [Candidatus Roizmanbacteria bacterium]|nr:hypothetical protein [Candidatus Roizmanbacteria bacterium]
MRRSPYQSLAGFLVLFFTLFLSGILLISISSLNGLLDYVETRPQVTVYFQSKAEEAGIFKIRDDLMSTGKVLSLKYISKSDAFKSYKELNKDNPLLLEMVSADILPASLEIYTKKPQYLSEVANYLKNQPGVDEVSFPKDITNRLLKFTSTVRIVTLVLFVYLTIMSAFVLTTTSLFKIALKKDEIQLLRLMGAPFLYIQKPYLLEGFVTGLTAATCAFLLLIGFIFYLYPFLTSFLNEMPILTFGLWGIALQIWPVKIEAFITIYALVSIFGISIATFANFMATGKYLRENSH